MEVTIRIFLYIYLVFLIGWSGFFLAVVYHMFKFGLKSIITFITTFIFIVVAVLMLYVSYSYIMAINWDAPIPLVSNLFNQAEEIDLE